MRKIIRRLICTTRTLRGKGGDSSDDKADKARKSLVDMAKDLPSTVSEGEYFFKKDRERIKQLRDECLRKHGRIKIKGIGNDDKKNKEEEEK